MKYFWVHIFLKKLSDINKDRKNGMCYQVTVSKQLFRNGVFCDQIFYLTPIYILILEKFSPLRNENNCFPSPLSSLFFIFGTKTWSTKIRLYFVTATSQISSPDKINFKNHFEQLPILQSKAKKSKCRLGEGEEGIGYFLWVPCFRVVHDRRIVGSVYKGFRESNFPHRLVKYENRRSIANT